MLGTEALSGLPTALFTLGAALTAFLIGRATQRTGRRSPLGFGFIARGLGPIGVIPATQISSPILLFASLFIYRAGTATYLQALYPGTDQVPAHPIGTAVNSLM